MCIFVRVYLYYRYDAKTRAKLGKYACRHGVRATARRFRNELGHEINEPTIRSLKKRYLRELNQRYRAGEDTDIKQLQGKMGRPVLLGNRLDHQVQVYLQRVCESGGTVTAVTAARGILLATDRSNIVEFGGYIQLDRHWAYSLFKRMNYVQRKATTAKSKYTISNFKEIKKSFLDDLVQTVTMEEIPPQLIMNWDQTRIKIVPNSSYTLEQEGARRVEVVRLTDKRLITAVFCGTLMGDFLPVQIIYKGKTS